jgi:glutamate/tyrosine decarboxylase-like PLP-dependent enzyme
MDSQEIFEKLGEIINKYFSEQHQGRFVEYLSPDELSLALDLDKPGGDADWQALFSWVEKYLSYAVKTNHPGFVNRMWVGANLPSVIGEIVTAISNTSSCTYESAPVSTLMEKYMLQKMLDVVGFKNGEGQITTGSSNANMIAMMAARNITCEEVKRRGLFEEKELLCFVNADAHYSMDKAANILGIGTEHLIKIPVNSAGRMDVDVLEERILASRESGGIPFFVGATAGTTVRGAYDPLFELLALREKYNFWLHVDGAWGGAVVLSDTLRRQYLDGIEAVDSFTLDFHKMLGTALMCNVFLINRRSNLLGSVCGAGDVSYIFREGEKDELYNLGAHSLQCGRRVDSLKWFLDWKFYGRQGFAKRIETYHELCQYAEEIVENTPELEMVVPRDSFNICFRFKAPEAYVNEFNLALRTKLHESGVSLVGYGYIDSQLALRLLITNMSFCRADIADYFSKLVAVGKKLSEEWGK